MKKVIVGSNNPVKLQTTKQAFGEVFPDENFELVAFGADSGVPDQPFGDEETKTGAKNRSDACRLEYPSADFFVGLEGGIEKREAEYWAYAWMCVQNKKGKYGYGRTGAFLLPAKVNKLIAEGKELSDAMDMVFGETNTKHKGGAVGLLTNQAFNRTDLYCAAVIFALIPFLQSELYFD